jgi:presenilin-like A22 family membrane protease
MGKEMTKNNLAFTVAMPTKEHTFEMGTGDLVIPLTFAVSVMAFGFDATGVISLIPSAMVLFGSLIGLLWTIDYSSRNIGTALPALPPQTLCMLIMFGIAMFTGLF